ncbi:MAG TPA: cupredoxin domain-containing protein [Candidatus Nanopelagicales bacterium]|jgi:plastocyanin
MTRPWTAAAIVLTAVALGTAGCASTTAPPAASVTVGTSSDPATAGGAKLTISGFMFSDLTVRAGESVTVTNQDGVAHTANVNGTAIDVQVPANGQATFTAPAKAGSYPLTCDIHPAMHGTLHVTA